MLDEWGEAARGGEHTAATLAAGVGAAAYGLDAAADVRASSFVATGDSSAAVAGSGGGVFSLDVAERGVNGTRGAYLRCAAHAGGSAVCGTDRGTLVRVTLATGEARELELGASERSERVESPEPVTAVWAHPRGDAALATSGRSGTDAYYVSPVWRRARLLGKLRTCAVKACCWAPVAIEQPRGASGASDQSTDAFYVGTAEGAVLAVTVDGERHDSARQLAQIAAPREPICAMAAAETLAGGVVLLVATPTRLFAYGGEDGAASVEGALQRVPDVVELPGFADHKSELLLHVAAADGGTGDALRYAWMAAPGVYHGELRTSGAEAVSALEHDTNGSGGVLAGGTLLSYPAMESSPPLSIAATEFHFAVLWEDRLAVINRLSERVAFEETLSRRYELRTEGAPLGFAVACGDLQDGQPPPYAFTPRSLLVLRASNEGGDIWRALLGRGDYEAALARCSTQAQRAVVLKARADACFAAGDYSVAADYYARGSEAARFEEVTLAFLEAGQPDALRAYLLHRLDALPRTDRSQITMLVTWLLELYLDKAARLQQRMAAEERAERHAAASAAGGVFETLADGEEAALCARPRLSAAAAHAACVDELRAFLADHHASLDVRVASSLLASYGREDELILLAEARGDIEAAVWFHLDRGTTKQALSALRRPSASAALRVRAAPRLMELDPAGAVDLWMEAGGKLEPRELLPALARLAGDEMAGVASADGADGFEAGRAEAVRYLEYAVLRLRCRDDVVHTLLLTMYVRLGDEARLMRYLTTPGVGESVELSERTAAGASSKLVAGPTTPYDARLALRLCRQAGMMRACVHIYCALGMFEEAVGLALGVSVELAKAVASQPDEGSPLRKKLWLRVARHVVEQGDTGGGSAANGDGGVGIEATPERFSVAMSFLKDAGGLLKVEDILPFFPDFVMIDNFKDAICASVEEYSDRIDELKLEMEEDTRRAEAIRADEERLAQRCVAVGEGAPCARCGQPVGQHASTAHAPNGSAGGGGHSRQPVYAFPDGTVYLRDCLLEEAIPHLGKTQSTRAIAIRVQMTTIGAAAAWAPPHMVSRVPTDIAALGAEELEDALGSIIGAVNPRVSEMAIKAITEPFVGSAADADAWAV